MFWLIIEQIIMFVVEEIIEEIIIFVIEEIINMWKMIFIKEETEDLVEKMEKLQKKIVKIKKDVYKQYYAVIFL